ncbi:MAG: 4-hydroxy-3-methylbut-2-enyl diphosphate reductase, partial [Candidatus Acidiferrum sp.]
VQEMKDSGYPKISPDQLVSMRIHGVDAAFVKEVRDSGYKDPSIDDLIELRIRGLRPRDSL